MVTMSRTDKAGQRSPLALRQRVVVALSLTAAVVSVLGLVVSTWIKSPAQVAADTAPPEPNVLTSSVVRKTLSTTVVLRGSFSQGRQIAFTPTSVAASSSGPGGSTLIITRARARVGKTVSAGTVALEISERPVIVLPGAFPAYRDLVPGESGRDVRQLQTALRRLGFGTADRAGYFGVGTEAAVRSFYRHLGYPVAMTDSPFGETGPPPDPSTNSGSSRAGDPTETPTTSGASGTRAMVPMSEVVFLPDIPARVVSVAGGVGTTIDGAAITFAAGGLRLTGKLDPQDAALISVGVTAEILDEATGYAATGTVSGLGEKIKPQDSDTVYVPLTVEHSGGWPYSLAGEDVRITVTRAATTGPVLAVPQAAISSTADGRTLVTVVRRDGTQHPVEVLAGTSADGWIEVEPTTKGTLSAGDDVVTGQ
jgi:hypothetical protein